MNWKTDGDYRPKSDAMFEAPHRMYIWESRLQHLNFSERLLFLSLCFVITLFAFIGNILTLYAVFARWNCEFSDFLKLN